jgi:hypothetical protein
MKTLITLIAAAGLAAFALAGCGQLPDSSGGEKLAAVRTQLRALSGRPLGAMMTPKLLSS